MAAIKPIEHASIHRIQSGQVIVDLRSVVKELVENSVDAGATSIEVKFKGWGLDSVEVQDNGPGIAAADFETVALRHHTSKLRTYDDLGTLKSFGFRGEALASLCTVADVYIVTARADEAPRGNRLEFDKLGALKDVKSVASPQGTTVVVENLFSSLPVRRQELTKHVTREYNKALTLLQAYACISSGVKFAVSAISPKGSRSVAFRTQGAASIADNVTNVFGSKVAMTLMPLDLDFNIRSFSTAREDESVKIMGLISRTTWGQSKLTIDKQLFFVNRRPCNLPQFARSINEIYSEYDQGHKPFVLLDLNIDTNAYDVNISPDKRTIMLHDQKELLDSMQESLRQLLESQPKTLTSTQIAGLSRQNTTSSVSTPLARSNTEDAQDDAMPSPSLRPIGTKFDHLASSSDIGQENSPDNNIGSSSNPSTVDLPSSPAPSPRTTSIVDQLQSNARPLRPMQETARITIGNKTETVPLGRSSSSLRETLRQTRLRPVAQQDTQTKAEAFSARLKSFRSQGEGDDNTVSEQAADVADKPPPPSHTGVPELKGQDSGSSSESDNQNASDSDFEEDAEGSRGEVEDEEPIKTSQGINDENLVEVLVTRAEEASSLDTERLARRYAKSLKPDDRTSTWSLLHTINPSLSQVAKTAKDLGERFQPRHSSDVPDSQIIEHSNFLGDERTLDLTISKQDFAEMDIIGQFNLGFIIVRQQCQDKDELFIVDQHASDEKYNFERLQNTTVIQTQRIVQPMKLTLGILEEQTLLDNQEALNKNGFFVAVDESGIQPPGSRCTLTSIPMSKEVTFDALDLKDLLSVLGETTSSRNTNVPRPPKVRRMFAMRACRSSIMIGKTLTKQQMDTVVKHMGTIDKPWNCPHGRPTMRHLVSLRQWSSWSDGQTSNGSASRQRRSLNLQQWLDEDDETNDDDEDAEENGDDE